MCTIGAEIFFHAFSVLIVLHAEKKKLEENKIKTSKQNKGRKIKTLMSLPIHLAHHRSTVELLSLRCPTYIATLLLCCCSAVATLSHRYCSAVAPPLSLRRCRSVVALLSHRYHTGIAPLSLRCCCSCCRYAVAPLSHCCRAVVEPGPLRPREGINNSILNCCCSTVTPLSLLLSIGRFTRLSPQEA